MGTKIRKYIRHPVDIPLNYKLEDSDKNVQIKDISEGGLCFVSKAKVSSGKHIHIAIPLFKPEFAADGVVRWCKKLGDVFLICVAFQDKAMAYAIRMIEQVCHIENYRNEILRNKGIKLTNEQAALEWIQKYADDFPNSVELS